MSTYQRARNVLVTKQVAVVVTPILKVKSKDVPVLN
jgi:hypothetical protein